MLHSGFLTSVDAHPDNAALYVDGKLLSYRELYGRSCDVANTLLELGVNTNGRCLLYGYRSEEVYTGVLGILMAGMAYVPLNPNYPANRNLSIITYSSSSVIIVDPLCENNLEGLLDAVDKRLTVVLFSNKNLVSYTQSYPEHSFMSINSDGLARLPQVSLEEQHLAYILFTSGTTGQPKGVPISHSNASSYIHNITSTYPIPAGSRFTQFFDLTFDLSVHDMFVCWTVGGCLYVVPEDELYQPADFVVRNHISHWFSVPSTAALLNQFRKLKPGVFPDLSMTMFCGEALPTEIARLWMAAAPNTMLVNLYGPTEATIAFTHYEVDRQGLDTITTAMVPIGVPLKGQDVVIIDTQQDSLVTSEKGELLLGGDQLSCGYLHASDKEKDRFFSASFNGYESKRWYRTGDIVSQSKEHGLVFHGRLDKQIKIRGYRVEIHEVESVLRTNCNASMCAVVPWLLDKNGSPLELVAFLSGVDKTEAEVITACKAFMPDYMVPGNVYFLDRLPLNDNGKVDYNKLVSKCEQMA